MSTKKTMFDDQPLNEEFKKRKKVIDRRKMRKEKHKRKYADE
jgi:hypothetical protein